ncbi:MAG: DUF2784 domain-containing protein [Verrucomicrobiota bacterium]
MNSAYRWLADFILVVHVAFVTFVVLGLALIWAGHFRRWLWVRNRRFRLLHLAAMGFVACEAVTGISCPLTTWENRLRQMAGGQALYAESFIQHWLGRLLFYDAPASVFTIAYVLFFAAIVFSWWVVKPAPRAVKPA